MKRIMGMRMLGIAAATVLAMGFQGVGDGWAHGMMGGNQQGWTGNQGMMGGQQSNTGSMGPGMMGGQQGWTGNQGAMGPGMMGGNQQGWTGNQGMMGSQRGTTGGMGPGMMGGQQGWTGNQGTMGPGMMRGWRGGQMGPGMMMGGPGMMGGPLMGPGMLGHDTATATQNLATLKDRLNITKPQESVWDAYTKSALALTTTHNDMHNIMHGTYATALEAVEARTRFFEQLVAKRKTAAESFRKLFDALTPVQKTKVNSFFSGCHGWTTQN